MSSIGILDDRPDFGSEAAFDRELFKDAVGPVTAEQLYVNQKVSDLISNAEMEQSDYRRGRDPMFSSARKKALFWVKVTSSFLTRCSDRLDRCLCFVLHWILRRQLEVRRS